MKHSRRWTGGAFLLLWAAVGLLTNGGQLGIGHHACGETPKAPRRGLWEQCRHDTGLRRQLGVFYTGSSAGMGLLAACRESVMAERHDRALERKNQGFGDCPHGWGIGASNRPEPRHDAAGRQAAWARRGHASTDIDIDIDIDRQNNSNLCGVIYRSAPSQSMSRCSRSCPPSEIVCPSSSDYGKTLHTRTGLWTSR